jgi:twitching motility protein PilT
MGMLVFGTLHTNNAPKTIDRIIDTFPSDEQAQVRLSLAESLAGVVAQLLLPTSDGKGRVAANEILLKTKALPNIIREANVGMLGSFIQQGKADGMQLMDDALFKLWQEEKSTIEDVLGKSHNPDELAKRILNAQRGIMDDPAANYKGEDLNSPKKSGGH